MSKHIVYTAIVEAVINERLIEPFGNREFRRACPGLGEGTYNSFLYKHRVGNPAGKSELFERISPGQFKLVRPLKYGLD